MNQSRKISKATKFFWLMRRYILNKLVPKFIWPKYILVDNVSFTLRDAPYSFGTKLLLRKGGYEASERRMISNYVFEGDEVIEMGGSIGILTKLISHKVGNSGRVISIEASKKITDYSKVEIGKAKNVTILTGFGFPVYEINHRIRIEGFDESSGSLGGMVSFSINADSITGDKMNHSEVYDLKTIIDRYQINPTLLVVDIEGSEIVLSQTPINFPNSVRIVLIELHPHLYKQNQEKTIVSLIEREGFTLIEVDSNVYLFKRKIG